MFIPRTINIYFSAQPTLGISFYGKVVTWVIIFFISTVSTSSAGDIDTLGILQAIEEKLVDAIDRNQSSLVAIARVRRDRFAAQFQLPLLPPESGRQFPNPEDPDFIPNDFGTGVIVDHAGLILTNYHVLGHNDDEVENSDYYVTTHERQVYKATIQAADPWSDLAVLRIDANELSPIALGDATTLRRGQFVISLGNPHAIARDGQLSASWGIVSNLSRKIGPTTNLVPTAGKETVHHHGTLIQTDAKLNLGTSGGVLVNLHGKMIGLTTSLAAAVGFDAAAGYAIPVDATFRRVLETLKSGREVEYGFLGVGPENLDAGLRRGGVSGVRLKEVVRGTPAAHAGLVAGDIVTHISGQSTHSVDDLMREVGRRPVGSTVRLTVRRDRQLLEIDVVLAKKRIAFTLTPIVSAPPPRWRGLLVDYATVSSEFQNLVNSTSSDISQCVAVIDVDPESEAWKQGLRSGMFISHVREQSVSTPAEFHTAVGNMTGPVTLQLASYRAGQPETIVIDGSSQR